MSQGYNNKSLFSDYYLEELVAGDAHWQALKKKAWEHRQRIINVLEKSVPGINGDTPEAEVERRLIRPILDSLEHVYFVQPAVPSPEGVRRPDYAFFPSPEARQEAESHKGEQEFFKTALAVGDAKAWERSLDKRVKGPGDPFTNHNPSYQIDFYLRATDRRWGLLTNGRYWRLYHRDVSYRLDVYYEVDLPQIIALDEDAFLYFLAFFHKEAFQPDGTGECFLDRAYRASTEYAAKVSEELKDNVYEALRLLAEGFLAFPGNNLKPQDLDLIRQNAFILIYRLLFIFYAEAKEFLPVTNPTYWGTYSLRALAHEIKDKEPFEANLHPTATGYWSRLQEVFRLINNGDDFLHIPPYNGRLFDDHKEHQSLAAWKIGDRYLAAAIDQLARAKAAGRTGRGFVSYRDLSIRELGSVYEGLLEHRPRLAEEDIAAIRDGKGQKHKPLREVETRQIIRKDGKPVIYRKDEVYLETHKGERKATGSYYTPQYIVEYIVKNTLGPLLEEAKKSDGNLIEAILALKVLDPAMGSGHFLVEATDYLARALVEALGGDPREMEEEEVRWARREVVERCIYGVDLNPLAVDLAKLSLWLSTVSLDKPLNFLDHHLRCGNSLIGARLEDLGMLPELSKKAKRTAITTLAGHRFQEAIASAVSTFHKIAEAPSDSVEDIHRKESAYETARYALSQIKDIADVWTSVYFGNELKDKDAYEQLLSLAERDNADWPRPGNVPWLDKARAITQECRFFHWELEFPEVFFDRNGQRLGKAGFHVYFGNPPWGSKLGDAEKNFVHLRCHTGKGIIDSFALFVELGLELVRPGGTHGMIYPDIILLKDYPAARKLLLEHCLLLTAVHWGQPFPDSQIDAATIIGQECPLAQQPPNHEVGVITDIEDFARQAWQTRQIPQRLFQTEPAYKFNLYIEARKTYVKGSIENVADKFGALYHAHEGIHSGNVRSKLFPFQRISENCQPLIFGREEMDRYVLEWQGRYVDYDPNIIHREQGEYANLGRPEYFGKGNILIQRTGDRIKATINREGYYFSNNLFVAISCPGTRLSTPFTVALLNSRLMTWYFRNIQPRVGRLFAEVKIVHLAELPIRRINFTTPKAERERLVEEGKKLYQGYIQSKDWDKVLSFIGQRLPQKPDGSPDTEREQSDVVHDLLAFLAEEMTRLHREKQSEVKGFLTWLEGYLGVNVEGLKNKTKVKEYWKEDVGWEGFLSALEQNRRAIQSAKGVDVTRREPQETIRAEFDTSVAKLRPLLERVELTDRLIDQTVYKLYGLTEEEMAVVEGQG